MIHIADTAYVTLVTGGHDGSGKLLTKPYLDIHLSPSRCLIYSY